LNTGFPVQQGCTRLTATVAWADLDLEVLGDGKTQYNNSHVDNTEMIEFTSATRSSFTLKVHEARWDPCSNGSKSTHFVIAWDTISPSELTP